MLIETRLWGDGKWVDWSSEDIERICEKFGIRSSIGAVSLRRDVVSGIPPLLSPPVAKADDGKSMSFTISTGSVDRMGDTINPHGWRTAGFSRNPVVLWAHNHKAPPVSSHENLARRRCVEGVDGVRKLGLRSADQERREGRNAARDLGGLHPDQVELLSG